MKKVVHIVSFGLLGINLNDIGFLTGRGRMKRNILYKDLLELLIIMKKHAISSEQENMLEFEMKGLTKQAKNVIADKQYWNGYLDALCNIEANIKAKRGMKNKAL